MALKKCRLRVRNKSLGLALPRLLRPSQRTAMMRLGSDYGGWWVPSDLIGPASNCLLAGAGVDITFDLALIDRFNCDLVSVDPTPRAIAHVASVTTDEKKYRFLPVGLSDSDGTASFAAPNNDRHVSHSMTDLQRSGRIGFEAEVRSVPSLMKEFGFQELDLLKIDIEGAEYLVLESLLSHKIFPRILCVEFDQPAPLFKTLRMVRRLKAVGYRVAKAEHFNVTFLHER